MMKIWERYILKELSKVFFFFLFSFYFLYIVIDYSIHMQDFALGKNLSIWKICHYYLLQFIKRMDILLPLALLIGAIKVLCSLNLNRELLAFQSAGVRLRKILRPFFFLGSCIFFFNLSVNEWIVPYSLNFIDKFHDAHLRHSFRGNRTEPLHVMHLEDHSKLIYQYYDSAREAFFDVIWIRNPKDLWRMRYLKADPNEPQGQWVDHLQQREKGCFEKTKSFPFFTFYDLKWDQNIPRIGYIPFENRPITELWKILNEDPFLSLYEKQEVLSQLIFKLTMPFLPFLVILAIIPFCTGYSKTLSQFTLYSIAIFSFVGFIAFMDAAMILGESDTLSPYIAILSPFIILLSIFSWKVAKPQ